MSAALKRAPAVAAVDEQLDQIRARLAGFAREQADAAATIDALEAEMQATGDPTDEIGERIITARGALEKAAKRHGMLEKVANEKAHALEAKKARLRIEALEQAEADARRSLTALDAEILGDLLALSEKFSARAKLEHDAHALGLRLQHATAVPRGLGNLGWDEAPLVTAFLARHPETRRPVAFAERTWSPFAITIPTLTPSRTPHALVADDEAAST